jgi:hypothetical protein
VRILVQNLGTLLYFKDVGAWTPNPEEALDFENSTAAIRFCQENKVRDVQVVAKFEESYKDIRLSIPQHDESPPRRQPRF